MVCLLSYCVHYIVFVLCSCCVQMLSCIAFGCWLVCCCLVPFVYDLDLSRAAFFVYGFAFGVQVVVVLLLVLLFVCLCTFGFLCVLLFLILWCAV